MWYLGERVMHQFSTSPSLVPHDTSGTMMDADALIRAIDDGAFTREDDLAFVHPGLDYARELLPWLAPCLQFDKV